jgi:hypothetical protein
MLTYTPQIAAPPLVGTPVNLQGSFNRVGIVADGSTFPANAGVGGSAYAYSAPLLGDPIAWNGLLFHPGAPGASNAIAAAGQTIPLPGGSFSTLSFLGTGVYGNQTDQVFTVTYVDGTTQTITQSMSDWASPQGYAGESTAVNSAYRDQANATVNAGPFYLYGYSFALNKAKVVKSITLPNNGNVTLLGMTLSG